MFPNERVNEAPQSFHRLNDARARLGGLATLTLFLLDLALQALKFAACFFGFLLRLRFFKQPLLLVAAFFCGPSGICRRACISSNADSLSTASR